MTEHEKLAKVMEFRDQSWNFINFVCPALLVEVKKKVIEHDDLNAITKYSHLQHDSIEKLCLF